MTFKTLYVFLVLSLDRRRIIHFNITTNPNSDWTSLQVIQTFPFDSAPRFLIRDQDAIFGRKVPDTLKSLGVEQIVISPRSRTHLGLEKDSPEPRAIQATDVGSVISEPVLGGLHHRYFREAA